VYDSIDLSLAIFVEDECSDFTDIGYLVNIGIFDMVLPIRGTMAAGWLKMKVVRIAKIA